MAIIVNQDSTVVSVSPDLLTISISNPQNNVITKDQENFIYSNNPVINVVASDNNGVVKTVGEQGPQGPIGPSGPAGGTSITLTAPRDLGGNRVVLANLDYADSSLTSTAGKAIGITSGAVASGHVATIIVSNELDGFFGFTIGQPVFLSTNGTVSQTLPLSGYIQKVGVAVTSTILLVNISDPIII
jgi:hypothetical protein